MRETYLNLKYIEYVEKNGHPNVGGSLYKVRLAPREDQYLYRDKPLSEQKYVQERLAKMKADAERNRKAGVDDYHALQREHTLILMVVTCTILQQ